MAASNLVHGLSKSDKEKVITDLKYSITIERLRELLNQDIKRLETPSKDVYENAAWAYRQADENGERRAYIKILKLLDHEDKNG